MVVVRLIGGLASQLHKYAVIKCICNQTQQELKVDLSFFNDQTYLENNIMVYGLPKLGVVPRIANNADIARAKGYNFLGRLIFNILTSDVLAKRADGFFEKVLNKLESYSLYRTLTSHSYLIVHVSKSIEKSWIKEIEKNNDSYVYGEFGVGFTEIEPIRSELSQSILEAQLSDSANVYKQIILNEKAPVAVHVRRGDYVSNKSANQFHGVCSIDYYEKSIGLVAKNQDARLFLFSDDLDWVKEHFSSFIPENTVFVAGNEGYEDFVLMASCKYHIIANSGFSSMASWLSMAPNKNVYSPARWLVDDETNKNQIALLPADWNYI